MTVQATTSPFKRFPGALSPSAVLPVLTTDFTIGQADEVFATVQDISTGANQVIKATPADFTTIKNADGSSDTTINFSVSASQEVLLYRVTSLQQLIDLINGAALDVENLEDGLDKLTRIVAEQAEEMLRTLKSSNTVGGGSSSLVLPDPLALNFLQWDATGTFLQNSTGPTVPQSFVETKFVQVSSPPQTVFNIAPMTATADDQLIIYAQDTSGAVYQYLEPTDDFSVSGSTLTLVTGLSATGRVAVYKISGMNSGGNKADLEGDGTAVYALGFTPASIAGILVVVGGQPKRNTRDFTITGSNITFTTNIPTGTSIDVWEFVGLVGPTGVPGASGDITGPGSTSIDFIPVWSNTIGSVVKNSLVSINATGSISLPAGETVDGRDVSVDGIKLDSITVGDSGVIATAAEHAEIANSSQISDDVVEVFTMADFPLPSAGVITLVGGIEYRIMAQLTTSDRFSVPADVNINFRGDVFNVSSLTYSGTGTFFTGPTLGLLNFFTVNLLSSSTGTLFDLTAGALPLSNLALIECFISGWTSLGTLDGVRPFVTATAIFDCGGITITDGVDIRYDEVLIQNPGGDLGVTFITINGTGVTTGKFSGVSAITGATETIFDIDSGIAATSKIKLVENSLTGAGTILDATGIDQTDDRVTSIGSPELPDSQTIGESYLNTSTTVTIVSSGPGGVLPIAGVNWVDGELERVTSTTGGLLTYTGSQAAKIHVGGIATLEKVGGGADLIRLCILKNGSALAQPCFGTQSSSPAGVSVSAIVDAVTGDTFQLGVYNNTSTANIIATQALIDMGKI